MNSQENIEKNGNGKRKVKEEKGGLVINIVRPQLHVLSTEIYGKAPGLLIEAFDAKSFIQMQEQNRLNAESLMKARSDGDEEKRKQVLADKNQRKKRDPKKESEALKIKNAKGKDCVQANWVGQMIRNARRYTGIRIKEEMWNGAIYAVGDDQGLIQFSYSKCTILESIVRVKDKFGNVTPMVRYRPNYHNWKMSIRVEYRADVFSPEHIVFLLQNAGMSVGLGGWRPEHGGVYGRFDVSDNSVVRK